MEHRKAKTVLKVVHRNDGAQIKRVLAGSGQALLPMLELLEGAQASIDELMHVIAVAVVEQLLVVGAGTGRRQAEWSRRGPVLWHGSQRGVLPVPYFHLVFTLPHALNGLAGRHARAIYETSFEAAGQTLTEFGANPRWLGGMLAFTLVLHTWAQYSNDRLLGLEHGQVSFRVRDSANGNRTRLAALDAETFIGRFLLHVLPQGLKRIRHYGLLANGHKAEKLAACRSALQVPEPDTAVVETIQDFMQRVRQLDVIRCSRCNVGAFRLLGAIAPVWSRWHPQLATGPPRSSCSERLRDLQRLSMHGRQQGRGSSRPCD